MVVKKRCGNLRLMSKFYVTHVTHMLPHGVTYFSY